MSDFLNRRGKFYVSETTFNTQLDTVSEALATIKFVPTKVKYNFDLRRFIMQGVSPMFDELNDVEPTPEYMFNIMHPAPDNGFKFHASVVRKV